MIQDTRPHEVHHRLKNGHPVHILDVREIHEYVDGHIEGANLLPLGQIEVRLHEIPHDTDMILVCRSGNRSREAAEKLHKKGFRRLYNLVGGMEAWQGQVVRGLSRN